MKKILISLITMVVGIAVVCLSQLNAASQDNTGVQVASLANSERKIGRPVRIASIGFMAGTKSIEQICEIVDAEGAKGVDLIILPEVWTGPMDKREPEKLTGSVISKMSSLAHKHNTYIISPIDRIEGKQRYNSAVLIDRKGKVVQVFNKVYPFFAEFDLSPVVSPGLDAPVYEADFGKIGFAICYDLNFPEVWQQLADNGAELVVWCSAYSGGRSLQCYSRMHHYYTVTCTMHCDCQVYDITGERILDEKSEELNISRVTLDLDRGIYQASEKRILPEQWDKMMKQHGKDIMLEQDLEREDWFVLKAIRPGVSARSIAKQYGFLELRDYIRRARVKIDERRGFSYSDKVYDSQREKNKEKLQPRSFPHPWLP